MSLDRRQFLKNSAIGFAAATLIPNRFMQVHADESVSSAVVPPQFNTVEEVYRNHWRWDKIVKASHGRSNCMSACSWDIYIRDGLVWREEQNRIYEASSPEVPDFNPRGCQKGACYSEQTYSPLRITHPMRRVGPRGSGRWERISWDDAYKTIADKIIDTLVVEGKPQKLVYDHGTTNLDFGPDQMWESRLFTLLSCTELDSWGLVGDEMMGAIQSMGMQNVEGTSDDWFHSDYIVVWMGNPIYTRIPDAHFMTEARYNGAKLVVVSPDYSATAVKSDLWVSVKPRTDAALIMSCVQVMIDEGLYKEDYVKTYTDLPFLVREDTGQFLRAADISADIEDEFRFFTWDKKRNGLYEMPGTWDSDIRTTEVTDDVDIALEGRFDVTLVDGSTVTVRTSWSQLLDRLKDYTPEKTAEETGVHPEVTRQLARGFGNAKSPMIYSSWGSGKGYHTDLEQRGKILLCALAGSHGKPGGGFRIAGWYTPEAWPVVSYGQAESMPKEFKAIREVMEVLESTGLDSNEMLLRNVFGLASEDPVVMEELAQGQRIAAVPAIPWFYMLEPDWQKTMGESHDDTYGRSLKSYMDDALASEGYSDNPYMKNAEIPSLFLFTGSNPLRRLWRHDAIEKGMWSKIDLVVGIAPQLNYSHMQSDIVLPAAVWYEKLGLKYCSTYIPYMILNDKAIGPLGLSKPEFQIAGELAKVITERAKERGQTKFTDLFDRKKDLSDLYDSWSYNGKFTPDDKGKEKAFNFLLKVSAMSNPYFVSMLQRHGLKKALSIVNDDPVTLEDLRREGAIKIRSTGNYSAINAVGSSLKEGKTITPHEWFIEDYKPYPTATGRLQFLIDHPWYVEADEALPRYRKAPVVGGDHPFYLIGGHTRWSIHSQWRESPTMLRLQRGEPVVHVSVEDAKSVGAIDGDEIEMYNDFGSCICQIRVAPAMKPGTVCMYHAWQPWQFKNGISDKTLYGSPIKPIHMVGNYAQLNYRLAGAQPGHSPRDTKVSIRKAS